MKNMERYVITLSALNTETEVHNPVYELAFNSNDIYAARCLTEVANREAFIEFMIEQSHPNEAHLVLTVDSDPVGDWGPHPADPKRLWKLYCWQDGYDDLRTLLDTHCPDKYASLPQPS